MKINKILESGSVRKTVLENDESGLVDVIRGINWDDLRRQKGTLVDLTDQLDEPEEQDRIYDLNGLISLLDAIQDKAVDSLGLPEEEVFGKLGGEE